MERTLKMVGILLGIVVTAGTIGGVVSKSVADAEIAPVSTKLTEHVAKTADDPEDIRRLEAKVDLLIEDCYRRGGCRR